MGQVPINLNSPLAITIQASQGLIANIANQYIVSTNGAPAGISGFVFDVIDMEEIHLQSDATDHFIETNSAIQDHVVQKPIEFTLKGFVGELKQILQIQVNDVFYQVAGLAPAIPLLPDFNIQDAQVYNEIANAAAQAQAVISAIASISSLVPQLIGSTTYQKQAYNQLFSLWVNRTLCTVQTPFGLLTSMLIIDLRPSQPGDTRFVSGFNVTFKQITQCPTAVTTVTNPAVPNVNGSGAQVGNQINTQTGGPVSNGAQPVSNFPSNFQPGSDGLANRFSDLNAPLPPTPGASSSGIPIPPLSATLLQTSPIFNTLPSVVTMPVAPVLP